MKRTLGLGILALAAVAGCSVDVSRLRAKAAPSPDAAADIAKDRQPSDADGDGGDADASRLGPDGPAANRDGQDPMDTLDVGDVESVDDAMEDTDGLAGRYHARPGCWRDTRPAGAIPGPAGAAPGFPDSPHRCFGHRRRGSSNRRHRFGGRFSLPRRTPPSIAADEATAPLALARTSASRASASAIRAAAASRVARAPATEPTIAKWERARRPVARLPAAISTPCAVWSSTIQPTPASGRSRPTCKSATERSEVTTTPSPPSHRR